jgi:hypothetical protein
MAPSRFYCHLSFMVGFVLFISLMAPTTAVADATSVNTVPDAPYGTYNVFGLNVANPSFVRYDGPPRIAAQVAWSNAHYSITCAGIASHPFTVQLANKSGAVSGAAAGVSNFDRFDVALEAVATGDLTGDGSPATAALLSCSPQPSNYYVEEVQVFTSGGSLIGELPLPNTLVGPDSILPPEYVASELSIQGGQLSAGMKFYGPNDSHATGPSIHRTVAWKWNGKSFVRAP